MIAYRRRVRHTQHWFAISYLIISLAFVASVLILSFEAVHATHVQNHTMVVVAGALQVHSTPPDAAKNCGDAYITTSPLGDTIVPSPHTTEPWWCGYLYDKMQSLLVVTVLFLSTIGVVWFMRSNQSSSRLKRKFGVGNNK